MKLTISTLSKAIKIPFRGNGNHIVDIPLTDSRSLLYPDRTVFFALTTPSNDGHRYVRELYRRGVRNFVLSYDCDLPEDASVLIAPCHGAVLDALQASAAYVRSLFSCPVIAVTGSRGKTVIKEKIARAFSRPGYPVVTSPRSWNSQTGVPLSVWRLEPGTALAVFEAGISSRGEMSRLASIIQPTIGVFTGLTDEHSDGFDSPAHKCREKALLFRSATHIIYIDNNPVIGPMLQEINPGAKLIAVENDREIINALSPLLGLSPHYSQGEISTRLDISEGDDRRLVAYDRYSTDLGGIETALDRFARRVTNRRLVTILSDLETRGADTDVAYRDLERLLMSRGVDEVIGIGSEISHQLLSFSQAFARRTFPSVEEFLNTTDTTEFADTAVLIDGPDFAQIKTTLESTRHDTCLEVNLDALTHNFNLYRSLVAPTTGIVAMVKADAYGAGAVEIARTLQNQGTAYLAVAVAEEGIALRQAGITMPVMVLNPITTNVGALLRHNLEPTIFSLNELDLIRRHIPAGAQSPCPIHIKLDTGMHRFGFSEAQLPQLINALTSMPELRIASIFSHLATADCPDMNDYTDFQLDNFARMSSYLVDRLPYDVKRHILNTAGITRYPAHQYDMVRLGIGLYGISPFDTANTYHHKINHDLKPVSTLVTSISALQHRLPGDTVGYGRRGVISRPSIIASLPIGYADGLNRHLGNGATKMIVNGVACPTVGNICMDICMIDVTEANASPGDRVEIFGPNIPVSRLSDTLGTIPYEILTSVAPRVKRIYFRE